MAMRGGDDETKNNPKYAHVERERRWLVDIAKRPNLDALHSILIEDRYISGTRMRLRKMSDTATGTQSLKLTKKYAAADPLARAIVTTYLSDAEHDLLWTLPAFPLTKRRYHIIDAGQTFSCDVFLGSLDGLELVEIEWPDDEGLRALVPPLWASDEVSYDVRFEGSSLAAVGIPKE